MHMYSVAWDVLVICTNHYLTGTGCELGRGGGGTVWGKLGGAGESCGGGELCVGAVSQHCGESDTGRCACGGNCVGWSCVGEAVGELYVSFMSLIHSHKCSICYSVACFSECVAEVVLVVQLSQTL